MFYTEYNGIHVSKKVLKYILIFSLKILIYIHLFCVCLKFLSINYVITCFFI